MTRLSNTIVMTAWLLLLAFPAQAERTTYKCTHPDGRIEYTALPLSGAECERITGLSTRPPTPAPQPQEVNPPATETPPDPRQRNCQLARNNLEILQGEGQVAMTDADGNPVLLDGEARAAALEQAQRDVDYWCQ